LTSGRRPGVKKVAESLSQHDEKHVVPTPLSGIKVGEKIRHKNTKMRNTLFNDKSQIPSSYKTDNNKRKQTDLTSTIFDELEGSQ
jgi:hypothetical protein